MGRVPANTKLSTNVAVRTVRVRGGHTKFRALRLDTGNYSWGSEVRSSPSCRVLECTGAVGQQEPRGWDGTKDQQLRRRATVEKAGDAGQPHGAAEQPHGAADQTGLTWRTIAAPAITAMLLMRRQQRALAVLWGCWRRDPSARGSTARTAAGATALANARYACGAAMLHAAARVTVVWGLQQVWTLNASMHRAGLLCSYTAAGCHSTRAAAVLARYSMVPRSITRRFCSQQLVKCSSSTDTAAASSHREQSPGARRTAGLLLALCQPGDRVLWHVRPRACRCVCVLAHAPRHATSAPLKRIPGSARCRC